ncbi:hypothetical protein ABI59_22630 [Acidobacteria bacterium Mor1]|nr:hypothetical protein ABI59_22630 [Acidobacteria bacterium Mor1]
MELHQLRYFVAVAETGGFVRAAKRCHVAQPSLSQQIRKLEDELGMPLFDRVPSGAVLTEAGRALLPRARRILYEVRDVSSELRRDLDAGRGPLSVGAIPTMAPYLLPPVLSRFVRANPDCELTVREDLTERLIEAVVEHELDLAIMSTPVEHPALSVEVIGRESLIAVAPKDYPWPAKPSLDDLRDQPTVVLHEIHCLGKQVEDFCSANSVTRRIVCRSTQLPTVLALVGLGLGLSIVPEMAARTDRTKSRTYREIAGEQPEREISVVRRTDRSVSMLAGRFVEEICQRLTESGAAV